LASLGATDTAFSDAAVGAGDSVRPALTFFFLADLESAGAAGFCTADAAIVFWFVLVIAWSGKLLEGI
jgi:hypothetical protein